MRQHRRVGPRPTLGGHGLAQSKESRINDAVQAVYAAALTPTVWPEALDKIAKVFDDVGAVIVYEREDGGYGHVVSEGLKAAQVAYQHQGWWQTDLRMSRAIELGYMTTRDAITERDIVTAEELTTLPFYTEFLAAYGLKWFAGVPIVPTPTIAAALSIQRLSVREPYTEEELALAAWLGRHVENALRIGIRLMNAEVVSLTLADTLARLGFGVFFLDGQAHVVFANPAARRLVERRVLTSGDGKLAAPFEPERSELAEAIAAMLESEAEQAGAAFRPLLVHSADEELALAIYVLPLVFPSGHLADRLFASARVVVVAIEATAGPPDPAIIRDLLGLTLGEARIAALVGTGLPPKEAADRLGIAEETARTVLKRVFAKTGVSRQSELVAMITRLVMH